MTLGPKIKRFRASKLLSQDDLARTIGREHSYLSRVETGVRLPSVETTRDLAAALDLPFMELMVDRLADQLSPREMIKHKKTLDAWREIARLHHSNLTV